MIQAAESKFWVKVTPKLINDASDAKVVLVNTKRRHTPEWRSQGCNKLSSLYETAYFTILVIITEMCTLSPFLIIRSLIVWLPSSTNAWLMQPRRPLATVWHNRTYVYGEPAAGCPQRDKLTGKHEQCWYTHTPIASFSLKKKFGMIAVYKPNNEAVIKFCGFYRAQLKLPPHSTGFRSWLQICLRNEISLFNCTR